MKKGVIFAFDSEEDRINFMTWFMDAGGDQDLYQFSEEHGDPLYVKKHVGYKVNERDNWRDAIFNITSEVEE